jgi:hypothetical protein
LLSNAGDVDGDALTAIGLAISVGNGTLVDNGDGTWNYTLAANDDTSASFSYTITDGSGNVAGSATLDITSVNDDPVAADDSVSTDEDTPLVITAASLIANDTDVELDALSIASFTQPSHGSLVDNGDGTLTYTPNANFTGTDSFFYTVSDGRGGTDSSVVTIDVAAGTVGVPLPPELPEPEPEPDDPPPTEDPPPADADAPTSVTSETTPRKSSNTSSVVRALPRQGRLDGSWSFSVVNLRGLPTIEPPAVDDVALASPMSTVRSTLPRSGLADSEFTAKISDHGYFRLAAGLLWEPLESFRKEVAENAELYTVGVAATCGTLTILTVGYTAWTVRGGYLMSSLLSSLPAWRFMDPLPVLSCFVPPKKDDERDDDEEEGDDETLQGMIERAGTEPGPAG